MEYMEVVRSFESPPGFLLPAEAPALHLPLLNLLCILEHFRRERYHHAGPRGPRYTWERREKVEGGA